MTNPQRRAAEHRRKGACHGIYGDHYLETGKRMPGGLLLGPSMKLDELKSTLYPAAGGSPSGAVTSSRRELSTLQPSACSQGGLYKCLGALVGGRGGRFEGTPSPRSSRRGLSGHRRVQRVLPQQGRRSRLRKK